MEKVTANIWHSTWNAMTLKFISVVRADFVTHLKPGDTWQIIVPHRDMIPKEKQVTSAPGKVKIQADFYVLPDRCEVPNTFSLKQLIQDALNAICPEVHKDYEEIDWGGNPPDGDDSQGYWKFLDLTIEEGYIHATIKKI